LRFKPPEAVLLIELVQHAGPLCPGHPGLDLDDGGLRSRQDRGMVGEPDPGRAGSRRDVAAVSQWLPPTITAGKPPYPQFRQVPQANTLSDDLVSAGYQRTAANG